MLGDSGYEAMNSCCPGLDDGTSVLFWFFFFAVLLCFFNI